MPPAESSSGASRRPTTTHGSSTPRCWTARTRCSSSACPRPSRRSGWRRGCWPRSVGPSAASPAARWTCASRCSTRSAHPTATRLSAPLARVAAPADRPSSNGGLNPRYTFATFIVGNSNRLAHAAAVAVAARPATAYNPLFIYGGVGLGKTHLLHAIGHEMRRQGRAVTYVSSERFTNDLINAIRMQRTEEFRARYRTADALLIDDIQFIAGKEGTQEEFFHTFNALHEATRQIVLSSDRPPKAMVALEERLRSRFEWGLIADIQPPDLETRLAILRAKAETQPTAVPPEVLDFLARRVQSNIRELEGSLNRVVALAMLSNQQLTIEVARDALLEMHDDRGRPRATPRRVVEVVAEYYGLDVAALRGKKRDKNVVVPRQVAMYLLREVTDCSLQEIGQELGGRDHTTVHHGYEKIAHEINVSNELRRDIFAIRERLSNPEQARGK
ncbi:MAG: chromosomal replication initiator protein DnaA [Chloroflexi bacterium]|nr:chromosomal replication initiator protein DnaA [Chloroflexota bacterium]